ncbi:DUF397 domain-containing protein [Streptomyces sp. B1866]|uniref:DUF397 domain-containing protein n=1 Tax=Streptomyces sp. B1866 TaxID=3075431 RepID=UPI002891F2D3|nr:DUF397 domain-containing protein [Streptomyces sp. B1866]MDT3398299.1 DUF397 domain-containing protein [Streptomyces sp. B1866]
MPNLSAARWRKSTHSGLQNDCVEVADGFPGLVPVRDSKNPHGPALIFPTGAWNAFVTTVKQVETRTS